MSWEDRNWTHLVQDVGDAWLDAKPVDSYEIDGLVCQIKYENLDLQACAIVTHPEDNVQRIFALPNRKVNNEAAR